MYYNIANVYYEIPIYIYIYIYIVKHLYKKPLYKKNIWIQFCLHIWLEFNLFHIIKPFYKKILYNKYLFIRTLLLVFFGNVTSL